MHVSDGSVLLLSVFFFFLNQYIIFFVPYKNFFREFHFKDDKLFF